MIIDYVYLILIVLLICFTIYIIYFSYEYNFNENNKEYFTDNLFIDNTNKLDIDLIKINNEINKFNTNYKNINNEIHNNNIQKKQKKNVDILNKVMNNSNALKKLKFIKNEQVLKKKEFPVNKTIKTIKSNYNSQYLSTFTYDKQNYNILTNDKCLTVKGLCKDEFCLLNCQNKLYSSNSQKFKPYRIMTPTDAASIMNVPIETISVDTIYPYNIFKSLINDKCLTISNDGITVEQCNLNNIKQQWEISPDENICVLE